MEEPRANDKISLKGYFERILLEHEKRDEVKAQLLKERFDALDKALRLQADEYSRRLHDLNGAYQRDRGRQAEFVTIEKYEAQTETDTVARVAALSRVDEKFEAYVKAETIARAAALLRVDEKFEDYVKRYEVRQREVDLLLAAQKGAAEQAIRAAEETSRKANRNLGFASVGLGLLVLIANAAPFFHH